MHLNSRRGAVFAAMTAMTLAAAAGCGSSSAGTSNSPGLSNNLSSVCKQGAKEGTVNYWVSYDADTFKKELAPFEQQYPKIKIVQTAYHGEDITQKLSAESQARHPLTADLIEADIPSISPVISAKLVQPVDWTKYGVPSDQASGGGVRTYRIPGGIAYNTKQVKASELPDTWAGLINSKWAGKIIYDPRGAYLQDLAVPWGVSKADSWFSSFVKTDKAVAVQGSTSSLQQVASGQSEISTSATSDNIKQLSAAGAPLAIKYLDVVPTLDYYAFIVKGAAHPNAAACFMAWWSGPKGVAQRVKYEDKPNASRPVGIPASSKAVSLTTTGDAGVATKFATYIANHSVK